MADTDFHAPAFQHVFDRIVDQVGEGLADQAAIAFDHRDAGGPDDERYALLFGQRRVQFRDVRNHRR